MVTVAIIALLVGILLPALRNARGSSQGVVCSSNLKQIATGWVIYSQLYDDSILPGRMAKFAEGDNLYWVGNGRQYRPRWFVQMGAAADYYAYNKPSEDPADDNTKTIDYDIFLCPSRPSWINNRNYCFGYNFQFLGNSRFRVDGSGNADEELGFINFPVKAWQIKQTNTVMAADSLGTAATFAPSMRLPYNVSGQNTHIRQLGNHGWALDPPRLTGNSDYCDDKNRGVARSGPDPRHQSRANFLFCDSHVEALEPDQVGYQRNDDGSYPMPGDPNNDTHSSNYMFSGTGEDNDPPSIQ